MLRTITATNAVRTFKPVQAATAARAYSTGFDSKEKAEEARYIRAKEQEQIKKLKEELARKEKEIEDLKKTKK
ncbi:hypothetical protein KI688_000285 [Linnemannia hyalina]|uniref:ATPase inhibitor, mitochondrial n=1 Tax=Linnemannia hyalina TaxID=64524 RepID=A0A9P7Y372_9FUNG|nr:hypothetical protein KI688_000285 [Linnemannia hyalina]